MHYIIKGQIHNIIIKKFNHTYSNIIHLIVSAGDCELFLLLYMQLDLLGFKFGESYVYWTVHHSDSGRIKDELDVSCYFISLLMCSTYFGH